MHIPFRRNPNTGTNRPAGMLPLAVGLAALLSFGTKASEKTTDPKPHTPKPAPEAALALLKTGNARFVSNNSVHPHTSVERLKLAGTKNQADYAIATVITCSDSRVPVERIFDAGIMDLFVIRVAGNVCDTDEAGSIEYGIAHVRTPVVVILGHTQCGAVTAVTQQLLGKGHALERNIPPLVDNIVPAVKRAMAHKPKLLGSALISRGIEQNVWQGMEDLFMASPTARDLAKAKTVKFVGAVYDVGTARIQWLPESKTQSILESVEANPKRALNKMADQDPKHQKGDKPASSKTQP